MSRIRRSFVSVTAATALLGGAAVPALVMAPVAAAHSVLVSISPEDGSEVADSPGEIVLTFNEEINQNFVTIAVTTEGDSTNRVAGEPVASGETVTAQVEDLDPGTYTVGYRVTSADGHVVSGSSGFRVVDSGAPAGSEAATSSSPVAGTESSTGGAAAEADSESESGKSEGSGGVNSAIWVVGGLAVVLIAGAFFLLRRGGD